MPALFGPRRSGRLRAGGTLVLRNEDLDPDRSRPEFVAAMIKDLRWLGLSWQEGPDCGGPFAPYSQSERRGVYGQAFEKLKAKGLVYPCGCSREDVLRALQAPHAGEEEPVYPGTCRDGLKPGKTKLINWRFRAPDGETVAFNDGGFGSQQFVAGKDFGDFVVWRHDGVPSYQLAVVADDAAMQITEVVRGADLLVSTARQLLLYRALDLQPPAFYHCPLMTTADGRRLAKREAALSLRALRDQGRAPESVREMW